MKFLRSSPIVLVDLETRCCICLLLMRSLAEKKHLGILALQLVGGRHCTVHRRVYHINKLLVSHWCVE